jgi:hypothetical protein
MELEEICTYTAVVCCEILPHNCDRTRFRCDVCSAVSRKLKGSTDVHKVKLRFSFLYCSVCKVKVKLSL